MKNSIQLRSGKYFDYSDIQNNTILISDIAAGLSKICRYSGQCNKFYSVAEHSVYVSYLVPPEDAMAALLHDAAEAYIIDMPKPLKVMLPDYMKIESEVEHHVLNILGIENLPESVKIADTIMLKTEQHQVFDTNDNWHYTQGVEVADIKLGFMLPEEAEQFFLDRYKELTST